MPPFKVVILGDGGVGKSALTIQLTQNHFVSDYDPTIENAYRKTLTVDEEVINLDILDTAGQEEYSAMRDQYIRTGHGFIVVYSITSRSSFNALPDFQDKILEVKDSDGYPMVFLGNKCDLQKEREVGQDEGAKYAKEYNVPFFETSAKARINVEEAFIQVVREIKKFEADGRDHNEASPFSSNKKKDKKKGGCVIV